MKIILIGFMGSGKTSVAKKLKQLFKLPILEMDEIVFQKTNSTNMHEVFAKGGEALLRETELAISEEHAKINHHIVSTGGGAGLNSDILQNLKGENGRIFFLKASFDVIAERLADDSLRPLFKNSNEAESMYHNRQPIYIKHADHVIDVDDKTLEEIAHEIADNCLTGS